MKVLAVIIGFLALLSIPANYNMVGKPREPLAVGTAVAGIIYSALVILVCMRVLGWA